MKRFKEYVKSEFNRLADWVTKQATPMPKIVDDVWNFVKNNVQRLRSKKSLEPEPEPEYSHLQEPHNFPIYESKSALKGITKQYTIDGKEGYDPESFMRKVKSQVVGLLNRNRQNKVYLALKCVMEKRDMSTGEVVTEEATFRSITETIVDGTDVNKVYNDAVVKMMESKTNFRSMGSNSQFRSVVKLDINIIAYSPLRGNSHVELPKELAVKKAIINLINEDDQCFKWAVTRALNPVVKMRRE